MQSLQASASARSGIPPERAFAIDKPPNLYSTLGHEFFVSLSTSFYRRVYSDEEAWFRDIFAVSKEENAVQNQYEFFIQRIGGPDLYSERKGHPALIGRHAPFDVSPRAAERWLEHMKASLDEMQGLGKVGEADKARIFDFLSHTAWFLVAGQEMRLAREKEAAQK
jgi:truncated hemoglobin YjbI